MINLGYPCINLSLKSKGISTNRTIRLAGVKKHGEEAIGQIALCNVMDLYKILEWNRDNGITLFRLSSDIIPWGNKLGFRHLPQASDIIYWFELCGKLIKESNQRITTHPGPFNLLASPKEDVIRNTIADLEMHSEIFDLMNLSRTPYNKINIHVGASYGDKISAAKTWVTNFKRLSEGVRSRLTIENDDKASMFSVVDLHEMIHTEVGIPIVFDYHHHQFQTGGLSEEEALKLAVSTWPEGIVPTVHYSESKRLHENDMKVRAQAHSDFINGPINSYGLRLDVMLETKQKDLALLKFRKKLNESL